jgi:ubiquinone/menaquinone biosynthesis C-methylase UbiE
VARDAVIMGFYVDRVLPHVVDLVLGTGECSKYRSMTTAGLAGSVVEIGFGSGLNVEHYPVGVEHVLAVEPSPGARRRARRRIAESSVAVDFVGLDGEVLPLEDESADAVLTTWTLCTIPDVDRALTEIVRVLRPGGRFHFLEHGLHPDERVQRWQHRLTPIQRHIGGGCHLDRDIEQIVRHTELDLDVLEHHQMRSPKTFGYLTRGVGVKPAA